MANTKINTLKQLRKAPNNGVVLATEGNQLVWKNVSDFTTASDASARTIANEVVEAKKAEIISQVNTAKFIGPVASTTAVDLGTVDSNDLVLVGTQAPYAIYAKINDALVKLGQTDVDLSAYETTTSVDQKLLSAKDELRGELVQQFEFNEFKNNELPTTIRNAKDEAKNATLSQVSQDYVSKAEANGKELEVQRQIAQAKQEAIAAAEQDATTKANQAKQEAVAEATQAAEQQAREAARTAGEDATRKAEQAKQEAITAAAQDATTKADGVKNELDPRITTLEQRADENTRYALYGFNFTEGFDAANIGRRNTKVNVTTGKGEDFTPEELNGVVVYLNGVRQTKGIDYDNIQRTLPLNGSFTFDFLVELDGEDTVSVSGHYLKEA